MTMYALIPAAGKSERMGRPKLTLPLGQGTVLEHVAAAARAGGAAEVLVVTRPDAHEVIDVATRIGTRLALLPGDTPDMRATVQHGLRWLAEHFAPAAVDFLLLIPADHPTLEGAVVQALVLAAATHVRYSLFVPTHGGRRGHPLLIRWTHVPSMLEVPPGQGLNDYFRAQAAERYELPWSNPEILRDLDTPEDYERLLAARRNASA